MIRYLIKNNFKLMFRNPWSVMIMLLGPILIIAAVSSAFTELMKSYEGVDEFTVGYRVENNSQTSELMESMKDAGEDIGIIFYEYPEGEPEDVMANNELAGFVEFAEDEYVLYQSADDEVEGMMLEYFLSRVMSESINASLQMMNPTVESEVELPIQELEFMPSVDAKDYYGMIYIVYFCWFGIICATGVLGNEKKYGIERKFQVSNLSEIQMYMGKFVPITMTAAVEMGVAAIITIFLFDIHWGNPLLSIIIILLMILAGNALALMLYNISRNMVITIIVLFVAVYLMGSYGGSFETYMFASIPDMLKQLSPIYHGNRALVELSCMGHSAYAGSAIIYLSAITVICSGAAILADAIRKRGRA